MAEPTAEQLDIIDELEQTRLKLKKQDLTQAKTWKEFAGFIIGNDELNADGMNGLVEKAQKVLNVDYSIPARKPRKRPAAEAGLPPTPKGRKFTDVPSEGEQTPWSKIIGDVWSQPSPDIVAENDRNMCKTLADWYFATGLANQRVMHLEINGETVDITDALDQLQECQGKTKPKLIDFLATNKDVFDTLCQLYYQYNAMEGAPRRRAAPKSY